MIVILLGPPGVGKGTQGVRLAGDLGWRHLSTGDLLRDHRRRGTDLGELARGFMDRGALVPDDLVLAMVRRELAGLGSDGGVIFDGFPRTVAQAEGLTTVMGELDREVDRVVVLQAEDDVLVRRLAGRRSCPDCGAVYNVYLNPPTNDDVCDRCGHEGLVHRVDDAPDTVRNRLDVYRSETEPLIRFYESAKTAVVRVDADQAVDAVAADIRAAVGEA